MKRIILFAIMAILTCNIYSNGQPKINITLKLHSNTFILGEAPACDMILENPGDSSVALDPHFKCVDYYLMIVGTTKKDCIRGHGVAEYTGTFWIMKPKEIVRSIINFSYFGVVEEGEYEIWVEYDPAKGALIRIEGPPNLVRTKIESNHVKFRIEKPVGIDAEVFSKHADKCNQIDLSPQKLLSKYPTSTYAAYGWFRSPDSTMVLIPSQEFLDNVHKAGFLTGTCKTDENGKTILDGKGGCVWLYPEDIQKGIVEMGTLILANHPDFVYRDELRMRIAQAYIYLKQYDNAVKELKLLVNNPNNKFAEKANEYINLMKQKGWIE